MAKLSAFYSEFDAPLRRREAKTVRLNKTRYNVPNTRPKHKSGGKLSNCASGKLIVMTKNNLLCAGREGLVRLILVLAFKSHYEGDCPLIMLLCRKFLVYDVNQLTLSRLIENRRHKWVGISTGSVSQNLLSFVNFYGVDGYRGC